MDADLRGGLIFAAIVLSVLIISISSCAKDTKMRISEAIELGVDPVLARSAFEQGGSLTAKSVYLINLNRD